MSKGVGSLVLGGQYMIIGEMPLGWLCVSTTDRTRTVEFVSFDEEYSFEDNEQWKEMVDKQPELV